MTATIDEAMPADVVPAGRAAATAGRSTAGSPLAVERALTALVGRLAPARRPRSASSVARHGWRGLHVDLARQFFPADDVEWLVDVAAWHGLNRLHLHLTDDEAWRFPVPGYPRAHRRRARGGVTAWPCRRCSGPAPTPYGGALHAGRDRRLARAGPRAAGIVIVPEIDLPGPLLRRPRRRARAARPGRHERARVSVQTFVDNVLNPGVAATWPFLEAVFGALADVFPSPWLHLGGDEVAPRRVVGSPAAQRWAAPRGLDGSAAIGDGVPARRRRARPAHDRPAGRACGRRAPAALEPGDGYVVGWTSADACRRLAAAGHDVVAAPASAVLPRHGGEPATGTSPAPAGPGTRRVADVEAFDPAAGWTARRAGRTCSASRPACGPSTSPTARRWSACLFPRLAAIADAAWPPPPR